ncbi:hypothetical protein [Streptomyces sp. NPDC005805]|uniref:hypothetical protein n=1 Tax=Streptomyces sp. NPDC005805 TaxID=3157068 RepID=UPI0033C49942
MISAHRRYRSGRCGRAGELRPRSDSHPMEGTGAGGRLRAVTTPSEDTTRYRRDGRHRVTLRHTSGHGTGRAPVPPAFRTGGTGARPNRRL